MAEKTLLPKDEPGFAEFLSEGQILIVDLSENYRSTIRRVLLQVGFDENKIRVCSNFEDAEKSIEESPAKVIISEYSLGDRFGIDLCYVQRKYFRNTLDRVFMLVTRNSSEAAIAEAAEEDVDAFVLKPFTLQSFANYIVGTVKAKVDPPPYVSAIQGGKEVLDSGDTVEARKIFQTAVKMSDKPSLAHFYLGQVDETEDNWENALKEYDSGLKINDIHYRCLLGKFEILEAQRLHDEAYEVVKVILKNFPITPQRMGKIFQLAVYTKNFQDIRDYYEYYKTLDNRPEGLVKMVVAGLRLTGKNLLQEKKIEESMEMYVKAIVTCGRNPRVIAQIARMYLQHCRIGEAEKILTYFDKDQLTSLEYKSLEFEILEFVEPVQELAARGQKLISEGYEDLKIFEITIRSLVKLEVAAAADNLAQRAIQKFPGQKQIFEEMVEGIMESKEPKEKEPNKPEA